MSFPLPTRREALRVTAVSAAFLTLPASLARAMSAGAKAAPANDAIRVGVIGTGAQGTFCMKQVIKHVVAVCDADKSHLAKAAALVTEKNGKCDTAADFRRVLERPDIDAVVVATPDHWHALPSVHACAAGKHVYCEKPLTLFVNEGRVLADAAKKHKRVVQTGSHQRSDEKFRRACELVRNGALGKVHTVKVGLPGVNMKVPAAADSQPPAELDYELWLGPAPARPYNKNRVHYNFRFFWDYSGGQLTNWGAHHLDITQWGLGMDRSGPQEVEGKATYHKDGLYEVPQEFEVVYKYAGGVTVACGQKQPSGVTFIGDKGSISVNRGTIKADPADVLKAKLPADAVRLYASDNHFSNWLECIREDKQPICDAETGHRSATVCHLGNVAIRTGRKIRWDAETERIADDAEANAMLNRTYRAPWSLTG